MKLMTIIATSLLSTASLNAFPLTIDWDTPTHNADGTPLTDLAGFRLYSSDVSFKRNGLFISVDQARFDPQIDTQDTAASPSELSLDFPAGVYYFRLTAFDTAGNESQFNRDGQNVDTQVIVTIGENGDVTADTESGLIKSVNVFNPVQGQSAKIVTNVGEYGSLSISIYDHFGKEIVSLNNSGAGLVTTLWNGRNSSGEIVAAGLYSAIIRKSGGIEKQKVVLLK